MLILYTLLKYGVKFSEFDYLLGFPFRIWLHYLEFSCISIRTLATDPLAIMCVVSAKKKISMANYSPGSSLSLFLKENKKPTVSLLFLLNNSLFFLKKLIKSCYHFCIKTRLRQAYRTVVTYTPRHSPGRGRGIISLRPG